MSVKYTSRKGEISFNKTFMKIIKLDIEGIDNEIQSSKVYGIDGYRYNSNSTGKRNISMEIIIIASSANELNHMKREIHNVFDMKAQGQLSIGDKSINCILSSSPYMPLGKGNAGSTYQRVLIDFECPDPYFYSKQIVNEISMWTSSFEFIFEIPDGVGMEFGSKTDSLQCHVYNEGNTSTGLIAQLTFIGEVVNPFVYHIGKSEKIKIIDTFNAGDILTISTVSGRKKITLIRENVERNYFSKLDKQSKFFSIDVGDNLIRVGSDVGEEKIQTTINHLERYYGV